MKTGRMAVAALTLMGLVQAPAWAGGNGKGVVVGGPFEVEKVKAVAYHEGPDADAVRHQLDFYYPKGQKDYPVVMFVHGGTWRSGSKDLYAPLAGQLVKNGVGVAVINY